MRARPHHYPCGHCGTKTECCGDVEQNYDGMPEWICTEYHGTDSHHNVIERDFLCDACTGQLEIGECADCGCWGTEPHDNTCTLSPNYEPPDMDGEEMFRDHQAEARDQAEAAWRLK